MKDRDAMSELARALDARPPDEFQRLEPVFLFDLAAALDDARARRRRALETAADRALRLLPAGLRGRVTERLLR